MKCLILFCSLSLFAALFLAGCGASENSNTANTPNTANSDTTTTTTKTTETNTTATATPASTTTTAAVTGVAACDEYLARVEKCMNNPHVPEASKAAYKQSLEQNRNAWKQAAATPQGKASLETSCKAALDGAKAFLDSCK
ncbi:MAG: hypothetical protein WBP93_00130 [Pyrinomonadaceae bacterium]